MIWSIIAGVWLAVGVVGFVTSIVINNGDFSQTAKNPVRALLYILAGFQLMLLGIVLYITGVFLVYGKDMALRQLREVL